MFIMRQGDAASTIEIPAQRGCLTLEMDTAESLAQTPVATQFGNYKMEIANVTKNCAVRKVSRLSVDRLLFSTASASVCQVIGSFI